MKISLSYPAKIKEGDGVFYVEFRDIENCFTYGETYDEAVINAKDVLGEMLKSMAKANEALPVATKVKKGEIILSPFPELAAPLELYLLRKKLGKTIEETANIMGVSKQRYSDIERGKNLTLKTFRKAVDALGYTADISLLGC